MWRAQSESWTETYSAAPLVLFFVLILHSLIKRQTSIISFEFILFIFETSISTHIFHIDCLIEFLTEVEEQKRGIPTDTLIYYIINRWMNDVFVFFFRLSSREKATENKFMPFFMPIANVFDMVESKEQMYHRPNDTS